MIKGGGRVSVFSELDLGQFCALGERCMGKDEVHFCSSTCCPAPVRDGTRLGYGVPACHALLRSVADQTGGR